MNNTNNISDTIKENKKRMLKNILASCCSNLVSGYNLCVINLVVEIMSDVYGSNVISDNIKGILSASSLIGCVIGQIIFGFIGDFLGRKQGLILCSIMNIIGTIGCSLSFDIGEVNKIYFIIFWRIILGLGIGGIYVISAVMSTESASESNKKMIGAIVFCVCELGWLLAPFLSWMLLIAFPSKEAEDYIWRTLFAIGVLPCIGVLCIQSSETYVQESKDTKISTSKKSNICKILSSKENIIRLLGTGGTWMIYDINCFGQQLFASTVVDYIFKSEYSVVLSSQSLTLFNFVAVLGAIASVFVIDRIGLRYTQIQGFIVRSILFFIMAIFMKNITETPAVLITIYCLTFFFSNLGPGSTTFLLPAAVFPMSIRATMNGFSAALGKVGAAIGTYGFKSLASIENGEQIVMYISGTLALLAALMTALFVQKSVDQEIFDKHNKHKKVLSSVTEENLNKNTISIDIPIEEKEIINDSNMNHKDYNSDDCKVVLENVTSDVTSSGIDATTTTIATTTDTNTAATTTTTTDTNNATTTTDTNNTANNTTATSINNTI